MIIDIEKQYIELVNKILNTSDFRATRNDSDSLSIFGEKFSFLVEDKLPILTGRKIFYKGVFGELAAMLRKPKHIKDFKAFGCNFWEMWADENGKLNLDYGNEWHAHNQIKKLKENLHEDRNNRRMIINSWNPSNLQELSLPCCHLLYQFYVDKNGLHLNWYQRSVDVMVGMPSNMVFSSALLIIIANEFGLNPYKVNMMLGDCHIYSTHIHRAKDYIDNFNSNLDKNREDYYNKHGSYDLTIPQGYDFTQFIPNHINVTSLVETKPIRFELYQ